jgi:hypothetical protein
MPNEAARLLWTQKITSMDKYREVMRESMNVHNVYPENDVDEVMPGSSVVAQVLGPLDNVDEVTTWWLRREMMREQTGVYAEPTSILQGLRHRSLGFGVFWPHISKDDPTMIAYTPDAQAGANDKQVKTTLGKLVRRWFPTAPDHVVARIEASHRAELDPSFPIARTADEIELVYRHMEGDTGCMRYPRDRFGLTDTHPSHVYAAPHFGVAYVERNGQTLSRSVIWVNPDNPDDKRYVRVYGDQVLKRKLERQGYRCAGLAGTKLALVIDAGWDEQEEFRDRIVMPYVDPAGGIHSGINECNSSNGVLMEDEDFVRVLTDEEYDRYRRAGANVFQLRSQEGHIHARRTSANLFSFTDLLTGLQYSRLDTASMYYVHNDGRTGEVAESSLPPEERTHQLFVFVPGKGNQAHACSMDTFVRWRAEERGAGAFTYNNAESIKQLGFVRLDTTMYPDHELAVTTGTRKVYVSAADADAAVEDGRLPTMVVLRSEVVQVRRENGSNYYLHISQVPDLKKAGFVPVGVMNNIRQMTHKTNPKLATTVSGRRIIIDVHDVRKLFDGRYEFERNCFALSAMGTTVWVSKNEDWTALTIPVETIRLNTTILDWETYGRERREQHLLRNLAQKVEQFTVATYIDADGNVRSVTHYDRPAKVSQIVDAARRVVAAHAADPVAWEAETVFAKQTLFWARNAVAMFEAFEAANAEESARNAAVLAALNADPVPAPEPVSGNEVDTLIDEALSALEGEWVPEAPSLPPLPAPPEWARVEEGVVDVPVPVNDDN